MAITWKGGCGKGGDTYTKEEIDALLADLEQVRMTEVSELPSTGEPNIIYLVPKTGGGHDMYIWDVVNEQFVAIGQDNIDLVNYALKDETVSNITRNGTTYTVTRADGTTFTFDQQTYGAATTSESGLMTPAQVSKLNGISAGAKNVAYTVVTGTSSSVSIPANGSQAVLCNVSVPSGYVAVGVVGAGIQGGSCLINNFGMGNSAQGDTAWRVDIVNKGTGTVSAYARMRVLCLKIS